MPMDVGRHPHGFVVCSVPEVAVALPGWVGWFQSVSVRVAFPAAVLTTLLGAGCSGGTEERGQDRGGERHPHRHALEPPHPTRQRHRDLWNRTYDEAVGMSTDIHGHAEGMRESNPL